MPSPSIFDALSISQTFVLVNIFFTKQIPSIQEKFSEILGTTLSYLNQIENGKIDVKCSTIDKFASNINKYDKKAKLKSEDLVIYDKTHITHFSRIDERK